jgi:hypothetical protein
MTMKTNELDRVGLRFGVRLMTVVIGMAIAVGPAPAVAQETTAPSADEARAIDKLRETFAREPTPGEVLTEAMLYFRVHPNTAESLRASTHYRALFPVLSAVGSYSAYGDASAQSVLITNPQNTFINDFNQTYNIQAGAAWDLRELEFNPSELQVYALVGYQQDLIQEITRTYFMRRQLQIRLALRPPQDLVTREILDLRVAEYTAILDAMTGGWFVRTIAEATEAASRPRTAPPTAQTAGR